MWVSGMGTLDCKSFMPGYFSMRDLNEDSSSSSWPQLNGFIPKMTVDGYLGHDKDVLKQKMIEHDQVFRNQVHELHRVYRLQRDIMEEARTKELNKRASLEPSSSSNLPVFQMQSGRHKADFPQSYSSSERASILGVEITNPPSSCSKRNDSQLSHFMYRNGFTSRHSDVSDLRPLKVRKKLFDLHLPAEDYVDSEDNTEFAPQNVMKLTSGSRGSVSQGIEHFSMPSHSSKHMLNPPSGTFFVELSDKSCDLSRNVRLEPVLASTSSYPFFGPNRRLLPSGQSKEPYTGNWQANSNVVIEGTAWGAKDQRVLGPSSGFGFVESGRSASHRLRHFSNGSCREETKPLLDINLNETVGNSANEPALLQDLNMVYGKCSPNEKLSTLPWLRRHERDLESSSSRFWHKQEAVRDLNEPFVLDSMDSEVVRKEEKRGILSIDLNLACEPEDQTIDDELTVRRQQKGAFFDLNSCASDCEEDDPLVPLSESRSNNVQTVVENKVEPVYDEGLKMAAEAILAISSFSTRADVEIITCRPSETSLADSLLWFVDAVKLEEKNRDLTNDDDDEFESRTLQLIETKEEDYLPKQILDDAAVNLHVTRARRGQSRRGRQRRDFQRDILPGLGSLSRHEITEDLQTFGGLMRATGHQWNLTRRNSGRGPRGRRRGAETTSSLIRTNVYTPLMQQVKKTEAVTEDRSLSGWGKTTRRPRRQRCPAGNPPAVALA